MKLSNQRESFKTRMRSIRVLRALSQAELAKRAELQPSAVSHFETGTRKPSFENLERLADALNVTIDYLMGRTGENHVGEGHDQLYRNICNLTADDRELAERVIELLVARSQNATNPGQ